MHKVCVLYVHVLVCTCTCITHNIYYLLAITETGLLGIKGLASSISSNIYVLLSKYTWPSCLSSGENVQVEQNINYIK